MSVFDRVRRKGESQSKLETRYARLAKERERLQMEREVKAVERENWKLRHPRYVKTKETGERAGGRAIRFAGEVVKEGARSFGKTQRTLRTRRIRRPSGGGGFAGRMETPLGGTSLSESIARNDWSGGKTIMNTDFYGSGEQKDFFGNQQKELINSNGKKKNQQFF